MQVASEIESAVKNIRYYSQVIKDLSKKQFDMDCEQGQRLGINTNPGTVRFDSLGAIGAACEWIDSYCGNIENNLGSAVKQDKLLHSPEEEKP